MLPGAPEDLVVTFVVLTVGFEEDAPFELGFPLADFDELGCGPLGLRILMRASSYLSPSNNLRCLHVRAFIGQPLYIEDGFKVQSVSLERQPYK